MAVSFKGAHFPQDIILTCVRWYVAYPLSTRHVEELMHERGVHVDHSTVNRWVIKYSPQLEDAFHRRKRPVWVSWRMDETYIKIKGEWRYLYRAVDKQGQTIDFLLTEQRDQEAALRFLRKAIRRNGVPEKITIDGSDANEAAIKRYKGFFAQPRVVKIIMRARARRPPDGIRSPTETSCRVWLGGANSSGIIPATPNGASTALICSTVTGAGAVISRPIGSPLPA
jgi:transposase-like protein